MAVVAASGGVNHALSFLLAEAGLGVSLAVGLGNAVDVTAADVLDHLGPRILHRAVALHVESVADGAALTAAVHALTERVPVAALVVGEHDVVGLRSVPHRRAGYLLAGHPGRAARRRCGTRRRRARPRGRGRRAVRAPPATSLAPVGWRCHGAGRPGDASRRRPCEAAGPSCPRRRDGPRSATLLPPLTFQANPVDTGRPTAGVRRRHCRRRADPAVDLVSIYALVEPDALDHRGDSSRARRQVPRSSAWAGTPTTSLVFASSYAGLGFQRWPRRRASPRGSARSTRLAVTGRVGGGPRAGFRPRHRQAYSVAELPALDEDEAKTLLERLGIDAPRRACSVRDEARRALAELGTARRQAARCRGDAQERRWWCGPGRPGRRRSRRRSTRERGARRFLVESMAGPGVDLIVGAFRDPVFGPMVLVGVGGVMAEALADVAVSPAPLLPSKRRNCSTSSKPAALARRIPGRPGRRPRRGRPSRRILGDLVGPSRIESSRSTHCASRPTGWSRSTP